MSNKKNITPTDNKQIRRICLFAGFNAGLSVADYVVYYVKSMSKIADVYYMADCETKKEELEKLHCCTKKAYSFRHKKYDFGSWQELIDKIGFDELAKYDELILCNDSCFGPFFNLSPIFNQASQDSCDFWGITDSIKHHTHLQSYFLVLKRRVFLSEAFRRFIEQIRQNGPLPYEKIIMTYEVPFTPMLLAEGFKPKKLAEGNLSAYANWRSMLKAGVPFVKVKAFTSTKNELKSFERLTGYENFIKNICNYDPKLITKHLTDTLKVDTAYFSSLKYQARRILYSAKRLKRWLWHVNFSDNRLIIRVLGKTLVYKNKDNQKIECLKPRV